MPIKLYKANHINEINYEWLEGTYQTSYDVTDHSLEINTRDDEKGIASFAELSFSTQEVLEEAFQIFEKFKTELVAFRHLNNDGIYIDLSNIDFPKSIKYLEFDLFQTKKVKINLLSEPHQALENVRILKLTCKYTYDFNQFCALPNLKQLKISYHKKALGWMDLESIIDLRIDGFKENDLKSLYKLQSLNRLSIFGGSIKSLDGIENLKNLEALTIFNTRSLNSLDALLKSTSIKSLEFDRYTNIQDWSFLKDMEQLRWLRVRLADSLDFALEKPNLIFWSEKVVYPNQQVEDIIRERYENLSEEERDTIQFNFYNGSTHNYYD